MERCHLQLSVRAARPHPIRNIDLWDSQCERGGSRRRKRTPAAKWGTRSVSRFLLFLYFSFRLFLISYLDDVLVKSDGMRGICLLFRFRSGLFFRANVLPMKVLWEPRFWLAYVESKDSRGRDKDLTNL